MDNKLTPGRAAGLVRRVVRRHIRAALDAAAAGTPPDDIRRRLTNMANELEDLAGAAQDCRTAVRGLTIIDWSDDRDGGT